MALVTLNLLNAGVYQELTGSARSLELVAHRNYRVSGNTIA